jgi:CheY-like chemotaxis protein/uncharacterized coiled-coil DUF342 family protein
MSQPNHKYDFDPASKRETRGLAPISSLPSPGLSGHADPTQEIRQLINQLQGSVREAREQVASVERERDELRTQLAEALAALHEIAGREEATRARFVEVTSVIRERDELLLSLEQHQKSLAEVQRRLDVTVRQESEQQRHRHAATLERDGAMRERDIAMRAREEGARERDEARGKLAEAQKQAVSLRQARDAAQAHCHELTDKAQHLTDQLAELSHERDTARKEAAEAADLRRRGEEAASERDRLAEKLAGASRELEAQRQHVLELTEQQSKVAQSSSEHASALAEAREEVLKLNKERDAARARAQEKVRELEELREELQRARAEAAATNSGSSGQDQAQLAEQLAAEQASHEEVLASLTAAQKQIEHIIRDRDQVRKQGIEQTLEAQKQIEASRQELKAMESKIADAERRANATLRERDTALEKAENFDQQRLQAIDVAAQLDAAKREIRQLTADIMEARLGAKAAATGSSRLKTPPPLPTGKPTAPVPARAADGKREPSADIDEEALSEKEAKGLVAEMKRCYVSFAKAPTDFSLLNELHCQGQHLAERARVSGYLALHRLSRAFSELAQDLYKFPEQVNPSTLRTVNQTIELFATLLKQKDYGAIKDPAMTTVFAVDDDPDSCDTIRLAMERISLRTQSAQDPAVALAELSAGQPALIFLDVALPNMDGFELCQHIRSLPKHAHTPIVFLTGLTTIENRVQSNFSGANDFIGKPFNLHELGVKAISLVLKASLHMD